jgi:hypothetical protein
MACADVSARSLQRNVPYVPGFIMIKAIARNLDLYLFRGRLRRSYGTYLSNKTYRSRLTRLCHQLDHSISVHYSQQGANPLTALCDRHGSDKGSCATTCERWSWKPHSYTDFYHTLFGHCRKDVGLVFECGLGTPNPDFANNMGPSGKAGASLRVWRDYFPHASIFGADIDSSVLFEEDRIRTFFVDQTCPKAIHSMWEAIEKTGFDFIIDDGMHAFIAGSCLFEHSFQHLRDGGIYVIEDVATADWDDYLAFFKKRNISAELVRFANPLGRDEHTSLFVIRK